MLSWSSFLYQQLFLRLHESYGQLTESSTPFSLSNTNMIYQVQKILDQVVMNNQPHFLIKWKNLQHCHDTWQPISNLYNIREYLKYWLKKNQQNSLKKQMKQKKIQSVKNYLYSGDFVSRKRPDKYAKYGKQILGRKKTWEKYIRRQQNTINLENDANEQQNRNISKMMNNNGVINEVWNEESSQYQQIDHNQQKEQRLCMELQTNLKQQSQQMQEHKQAFSQKDQSDIDNFKIKVQTQGKVAENQVSKPQQLKKKIKPPKKQKKPRKQRNIRQKAKKDESKFKVIGQVDLKQIKKIIKRFLWQQVPCLLVEMENGQCFNVRQSQLKVVNSALLLQFFEDNGIDF